MFGKLPRQLLFVQGAGNDVHDTWDDKLVASLRAELGDGFNVLYPKMPNEAHPRFTAWTSMLLDQFELLKDGDVLVGHSVGGAALLHTLAGHPVPFTPGALVLLAPPFIGSDGWPSDQIAPRSSFVGLLPSRMPIRLYHGTADDSVPCAHAALYGKALTDAVVSAIPNGDHQFGNDCPSSRGISAP
jgi:predicted alpha/beta hydrolase family esterase